VKVSEALEDAGLDPYYQRKFQQIVLKAGLTDLDLEKDWQLIKRQLKQTPSFNPAALLGSIWGAYRQAPYWQAAVALNLVAIAIALIFQAPAWFTVAITAPCAMYLSYGNSLLLLKYLRSRIRLSSLALVQEEMQPNGWAATLAATVAIAWLGAVFAVDLNRHMAPANIAGFTVPENATAENPSEGNWVDAPSQPDSSDSAPSMMEAEGDTDIGVDSVPKDAQNSDEAAQAAMDAAANASDAMPQPEASQPLVNAL